MLPFGYKTAFLLNGDCLRKNNRAVGGQRKVLPSDFIMSGCEWDWHQAIEKYIRSRLSNALAIKRPAVPTVTDNRCTHIKIVVSAPWSATSPPHLFIYLFIYRKQYSIINKSSLFQHKIQHLTGNTYLLLILGISLKMLEQSKCGLSLTLKYAAVYSQRDSWSFFLNLFIWNHTIFCSRKTFMWLYYVPASYPITPSSPPSPSSLTAPYRWGRKSNQLSGGFRSHCWITCFAKLYLANYRATNALMQPT